MSVMFPESWRETTVGNVILDLQPGFAQKPGEEDEGTTPQIRTHNITPNGKISLKGIKHISASVKESARYTLMKGDVIFNNTNSEEWVGKTAMFDQDGEYVFSNHMTRLRVHHELIMPEYLAIYLHLLWSMGYSKTRAKRWVSQAGIDSAALSSFSIILPTLPEQKRIVDILQQADSVVLTQQSRHQQLDLMIKAALERIVFAIDETDWKPIGEMVETRYGTSVSANESVESGTPILRIPNIMGGEVNTTDMKYVNLSKAELDRLQLIDTDVLIVRSNGNPDYVGRSAPITKDLVPKIVVYASYLIRLRTDINQLLPEYLSAFLNSAFGRAAMRNAIRTTAGQSNLSGENLTKVRLPVPTIAEQLEFKKFWLEVHRIRKLIDTSSMTANELVNELVLHVLSGGLTKNWRNENKDEITAAAAVRDALLRERGVKLKTAAPEPSVSTKKSIDLVSPARQWIVGELSGFQRQVLAAFLAYPEQPLIVEDENSFITFCDSDEVSERLQDFGTALNNQIRRTLSQLAALGLIAQVTLPKLNDKTGEREYLKAFRPLRETDFSRLSDIESIKRALNPQTEDLFYFLVNLDYETSESAGAGGMFQVISIKDEERKDFTHLVDQGRHYLSLDELREDIASALKVSSNQIELEEE